MTDFELILLLALSLSLLVNMLFFSREQRGPPEKELDEDKSIQKIEHLRFPLYSNEEYPHMMISLLKRIAKDKNISGYEKMSKTQLIEALSTKPQK